MKRMLVAAAAVALLVSYADRVPAAETDEVIVNSAKLDITHGSGSEPIDQADMVVTFTSAETGEGAVCENSDAPVSVGVTVTLQQGVCGTATSGERVTIPFFTPVAQASRVAKFEGATASGANVDAVLRTLRPRHSCGRWNLRLDAVPLDLSTITNDPVALSVTLPDGSFGCATVNARIDS